MTPEDAEEYTQALGQVVAGGWRQIALGQRLGVPKALGISTEEWVNGRLGGYIKLSVEERQKAAQELKDEGNSQRQIASVLGVGLGTVERDLAPVPNGTSEPVIQAQKEGMSVPIGTLIAPTQEEPPEAQPTHTPDSSPLDVMTGLAANEAMRKHAIQGHDPGNYHVSDDSYEWYTPVEYIEAARSLMGSIDLDPASCEEANTIVRASHYYTIDNNGLDKAWAGNIWINPPYNMPWIESFAERVVSDYSAGNISQAVVLTNNATDTAWFHRLMDQGPFCLTKGRIRFWGPGGEVSLGPRQGQAIFYLGPHGSTNRFCKLFREFGAIVLKVHDDDQ